MTARFEAAWAAWNGAAGGRARGLGRRRAGRARLRRRGGRDRAVPLQHVHGDAAGHPARRAAGRSSSTATATTSACRSPTSRRKAERHRPRAAVLVHIGGHLAFESERIAELLPRPRASSCSRTARTPTAPAGTAAGPARSATRASTRSTRPRPCRPARAACSSRADDDLLAYARAFRDYGKPDYDVAGLNFRMSEFTAALALVQTERMEEIVAWKNDVAREHLDPLHPRPPASCPTAWSRGSTSTSSSTRSSARPARSTTEPCHRIMGTARRPAQHRLGGRATTGASRSTTDPEARRMSRVLVTGGVGLHRLARRRPPGRRPATGRASSTCAPSPCMTTPRSRR